MRHSRKILSLSISGQISCINAVYLTPHICNRKFSISLFIVSGSSVLELCPAPLIHSRGIPVFLCHALLYLIHEPALSWSPQISSAGHLISYGRFFSLLLPESGNRVLIILHICPGLHHIPSSSQASVFSRIRKLPRPLFLI